jgi:hypothetical protein
LTVKNFGHFVSKIAEETKSEVNSVKMVRVSVRTKFRCLENVISKAAVGFLKQKVLPELSPLRKENVKNSSYCFSVLRIVPLREVFKVDETG